MRQKKGTSAKSGKRARSYFNFFSSSKKTGISRTLAREIDRAERYGQVIGILIVEFKGIARKNIHKLLPGIPLSMEWLAQQVRDYDCVQRTSLYRYTILLPQTDLQGVDVVKSRIVEVGRDMGWTYIRMGVATFPQDGGNSEELLKKADVNLSQYIGKEEAMLKPHLSKDDFDKLL